MGPNVIIEYILAGTLILPGTEGVVPTVRLPLEGTFATFQQCKDHVQDLMITAVENKMSPLLSGVICERRERVVEAKPVPKPLK